MPIYRLKHDPATGDFAIYTVPSHASADNDPLYDPFDHTDRLQFTVSGVQPSTTDALTQINTVTIPTQAAGAKYAGQINLFAHGQGEPCMVEGRIMDLDTPGNHVAFNGTMPVNVTSSGHATWLALGANNTHVVLVYFGITHAGFSAFNLDIEASAYDYLWSGAAPAADPGRPMMKYLPGSHAEFGRGLVDTRRRHLRRVGSGGDFALSTSPTLTIIGAGISGAASYVQNELGWRWRYSCDGYVKQTTVGWNGAATDGGNANANFIRVKR